MLFPPKEKAVLTWLPASDTRKFEKERRETDADTFHAKNYTRIKQKSFLLNKEYLQKEHKKFAIGSKWQISAVSHF